MAKIKVKRKSFSDYMSKNMNALGLDMLSLVSPKAKTFFEDTPDEQVLWIDTDFIYAITEPFFLREVNVSVYQVHIAEGGDKTQSFWLLADSYEELLNAWRQS